MSKLVKGLVPFLAGCIASAAWATPYTENVPAPTSLPLPAEYPAAGGVVIVLTGANGNIYYQFSNPTGAFRGFNNNGTPAQFEGNPFTVNNPIALDCGFASCTDYFGGSVARIDIRFSAYDGDTQPGGFDNNDINLFINGFDVGSWSGIQTQVTSPDGNTNLGFATGFGNNTFNTAWFSSTNTALLNNILSTGQTVSQVFDDDPNDNFWDFRRGDPLPNGSIETVAPGYELEKTVDGGATSFTQVGEVITYNYIVSNIGSVAIENISVIDDKIGTVSCSPTTLPRTPDGSATPNQASCTGTYTVTQADVDAGTLTNIAQASGTPEFGALGPLTDSVTMTGPPQNPLMALEKIASAATFATAGDVISYDFTVTNTGNVTWPAPPTLVDALTDDEACPAGPVAPGGTVTCTASYEITLDDMDSGSVPNTADASITVGGVTKTGQATATVTADVTTSLGIEKTLASGANPITTPTDELVYSYLLTNNSNLRLDTFAVTDDKVSVTCPVVVLDPGQTVTCTSATYDVLQSDIDNGGVTNTATATAQTILDVDVTSAEVDLLVPATQQPALSMSKASDPSPVPVSLFTPGANVDYVYTVTNTGNVTITDAVTVTDDKFTSPIACPAGPIAPAASVECRGTYTITAADVAAGTVVNVATASDGTVTSNSDSVAIPQAGAPGVTLTKTADTTDYDDLTDTITYTFMATNSGDTTIVDITPITITDPLLGTPFTCTEQPAVLSPAGSFSCSRTYGPVTQADIDAGQIVNTATAAFTVGGVTFTSPSASATVTSSVVPLLSLEKTGVAVDGGAQYDTVGEGITYTFAVTNDGTQTLASVVVTDPLIPALSCTISNLAPGATDNSCTGTYTVTQSDLDAGSIVNTATALGTSPTGKTETGLDEVTITIDPAAQTRILSLDKTASATTYAATGDTITYAIEVSNAGNLTLENVVVTDPALGLTCNIGTSAHRHIGTIRQ